MINLIIIFLLFENYNKKYSIYLFIHLFLNLKYYKLLIIHGNINN